MGASSTTLCPLHPKWTRTIRNSWLTGSTCFTAALMRPPTPLSASALLQMCLPLQSAAAFRLWHEGNLYDDWSAAGLSTPDDVELQAIADRVCQAYNVGLEDVQQIHVFSNSASQWTCLTTRDNTCPYPFAKCWCLGSHTTQITVSNSTTSHRV
jgi:hypothetical protein